MRSVLFTVCVDLRHFFPERGKKIECRSAESREGYYILRMTSADMSTWLLGIGGYAGLFGSFAIFYLYPNFPRKYLPALFVVPVVSAAALYVFFQLLYLLLEFVVLVLQAMLDENITIVLVSTTFIVGQAALVGYVVYKNAFLNNVVLNNAVDDDEDETQTEEQEEEQTQTQTHGEELQPEEYEDANEDDSGADADNEEGILNSGNAPVTNDTPATAAPVIPPQCVSCDDDCTKCMPPLISLGEATGLSGEFPAGVVCEGGVCRIDAASIKKAMDNVEETVKID